MRNVNNTRLLGLILTSISIAELREQNANQLDTDAFSRLVSKAC